MDERFPAKLLLFGEYAILKGGDALSVPLFTFGGELLMEDSGPIDSDLQSYSEFLSTDFDSTIDVESFRKDVAKGLRFSSDIPRGYGCGSSGALVAAIMDRYGKSPLGSRPEIREKLGKMESYFHGKSSGLDALVSYLRKPVQLSEGELAFPTVKATPLDCWLIDSEREGLTSRMVAEFRAKPPEFDGRFEHYMAAGKRGIKHWLSGDGEECWEALKSLSDFGLKEMDFAIPEKLHQPWKEGLESGRYFFKLCGSGGGGFFLCFTKKGDSEPVRGLKKLLISKN